MADLIENTQTYCEIGFILLSVCTVSKELKRHASMAVEVLEAIQIVLILAFFLRT
jgi:hypothetical protein